MHLGNKISQELEHIELEDDEELDDEPVFVLTDEWREFFAKSEAKRKLGIHHKFWKVLLISGKYRRCAYNKTRVPERKTDEGEP
ncbi:hypothetical protein Lal_00012020 [Lupinus albus]|nr:hypothetical protein Lal_00012020 [Lupinus albus]